MADMRVSEEEISNYEVFRDCFSEPILRRLAPKVEVMSRRKTNRKSTGNISKSKQAPDVRDQTKVATKSDEGASAADDLSDFIDYIATGIFTSLPPELRTLSYETWTADPKLQEAYSLPLTPEASASLASHIPPDLNDTLSTYLAPSTSKPEDIDIPLLLLPVFSAYFTAATTPPPVSATTRASACELCERSWINLTYHHLIPRSTHAKVLKRGWHPEWRLNSVAWLCRQCHSFVHRIASNEDLAREFWNMELIKEADGVEGWVNWVGRVRWKKR